MSFTAGCLELSWGERENGLPGTAGLPRQLLQHCSRGEGAAQVQRGEPHSQDTAGRRLRGGLTVPSLSKM